MAEIIFAVVSKKRSVRFFLRQKDAEVYRKYAQDRLPRQDRFKRFYKVIEMEIMNSGSE